MKKLTILLTLAVVINACWPCKTDPIIIDNGPIPMQKLAFIPYQNDSTYQLRHSKGQLITFQTERGSYDEWTQCDHCCDYEYHYQINSCILSTEYPLFDIEFHIDNQDSIYLNGSLHFANSSFNLPLNKEEQTNKADSIINNGHVYYEVYKIKSYDYSYYHKRDSIYADSLYYNKTVGIIKVLMSNGESYESIK